MVLFLKTDPGYTQKQIRTSRLLLLFPFTRLSVSYSSVSFYEAVSILLFCFLLRGCQYLTVLFSFTRLSVSYCSVLFVASV